MAKRIAAGHDRKRSIVNIDSSTDFFSKDTNSVSNVKVASAEKGKIKQNCTFILRKVSDGHAQVKIKLPMFPLSLQLFPVFLSTKNNILICKWHPPPLVAIIVKCSDILVQWLFDFVCLGLKSITCCYMTLSQVKKKKKFLLCNNN